MATLTIRGLEEQVRQRLRIRAAQHGRSMEAEVRAVLQEAVGFEASTEYGLGSRIHARFTREVVGDVAGVEAPARTEPPRAAVFDA